jgi:hypothetical protein
MRLEDWKFLSTGWFKADLMIGDSFVVVVVRCSLYIITDVLECSNDRVTQSGNWIVRTDLARIALLRRPIDLTCQRPQRGCAASYAGRLVSGTLWRFGAGPHRPSFRTRVRRTSEHRINPCCIPVYVPWDLIVLFVLGNLPTLRLETVANQQMPGSCMIAQPPSESQVCGCTACM